MTALDVQGAAGPPRRQSGSEYAYHEGRPRRLGGFSKPLGVLLILYIIAALAVAGLAAYGFVDPRLLDPDALEMADMEADGLLLTVASLFFLTTLIERAIFFVCVFLVCRFSYRAMRNLYTVRSAIPDMSPAATVYWYFVPFASWFMPPSGMSEILKGSLAEAGLADKGGAVSRWWGCWIISILAATIANFSFVPPEFTYPAIIVAMVFSALAAFLLGQLVTTIAEAQLFLLNADAASQFA